MWDNQVLPRAVQWVQGCKPCFSEELGGMGSDLSLHSQGRYVVLSSKPWKEKLLQLYSKNISWTPFWLGLPLLVVTGRQVICTFFALKEIKISLSEDVRLAYKTVRKETEIYKKAPSTTLKNNEST